MNVILPEPAPRALRLYWLMLAGMLVVWLGCEAMALAGVGRSPAYLTVCNLGHEPTFAVALGSVFFLHFASRPGTRDLAIAAALGLVVGAAFYLFRRWQGLETLPANLILAGTGVGSLSVLTWRAWQNDGGRRAQVLGTLLPGALLAGLVALSLYLLSATVFLRPVTDDAILYAADEGLGGQASFLVGRLFHAVPPLAAFATLIYNLVPAAFVLLLILHQRADPLHLRTPLPVFLVASVVGYGLYLLFPAVGPLYCLREFFPIAPPPVAEVLAGPLTIHEPAIRNCMPSLHTGWALLLCWHARPLPRWFRILAIVFLICTLLATLGLGLHYAIDLVVAFPFVLAMQAATVPAARGPRIASLALGASLVAAWLLLIRFGLSVLTVSRPLTAMAAVATVVVSLLAERRLWRSAPLFSVGLPDATPLHPERHFHQQVAQKDQSAAQE